MLALPEVPVEGKFEVVISGTAAMRARDAEVDGEVDGEAGLGEVDGVTGLTEGRAEGEGLAAAAPVSGAMEMS